MFPSAIEAIIRESAEIAEYAVEVFEDRGMFALRMRIEVRPAAASSAEGVASQLKEAFHRRLFLKTDVEIVPAGSLPRFDGKAKRVTKKVQN